MTKHMSNIQQENQFECIYKAFVHLFIFFYHIHLNFIKYRDKSLFVLIFELY